MASTTIPVIFGSSPEVFEQPGVSFSPETGCSNRGICDAGIVGDKKNISVSQLGVTSYGVDVIFSGTEYMGDPTHFNTNMFQITMVFNINLVVNMQPLQAGQGYFLINNFYNFDADFVIPNNLCTALGIWPGTIISRNSWCDPITVDQSGNMTLQYYCAPQTNCYFVLSSQYGDISSLSPDATPNAAGIVPTSAEFSFIADFLGGPQGIIVYSFRLSELTYNQPDMVGFFNTCLNAPLYPQGTGPYTPGYIYPGIPMTMTNWINPTDPCLAPLRIPSTGNIPLTPPNATAAYNPLNDCIYVIFGLQNVGQSIPTTPYQPS